MALNQIALGFWDRQDSSRSIWLCYRLKHLHNTRTVTQLSQQRPLWRCCCPGEGGFVPVEFTLLCLAGVYVSQTESNLLPADELYWTDVHTVGEVMEAFSQIPEETRSTRVRAMWWIHGLYQESTKRSGGNRNFCLLMQEAASRAFIF